MTGLLDLPDHIIVENVLPELFPSSLSDDRAKSKDLRDIISFASTCKRIHELASHPSLWRRVNAAVFSDRYETAVDDEVAPPPLPLGAVHCGAFRLSMCCLSSSDVALMRLLPELTNVSAIVFPRLQSEDLVRVRDIVCSLPHLKRLSLYGADPSFIVRPSVLPALEFLGVSCGEDKMERFFSANTFPRLTGLDVSGTFAGSTIAVSCPNLVDIAVTTQIGGSELAALAIGCLCLRKLDISTCGDVFVGAAPSTCAAHLRELTVKTNGRVAGSFLSLFPCLVRLELNERPLIFQEDLHAIGGMDKLEHFQIVGYLSANQECRSLLPLANHPSTKKRQSLKSLVLIGFGDADFGEFMSSPWCSHLEELEMRECLLSREEMEAVIRQHGATLKVTLKSFVFEAMHRVAMDEAALGWFVAQMSALRRLLVGTARSDFEVNEFIAQMAAGSMKLDSFNLDAVAYAGEIDVSPFLPALREATDITIYGNIDGVAGLIASECHCVHNCDIKKPGFVFSSNDFCI